MITKIKTVKGAELYYYTENDIRVDATSCHGVFGNTNFSIPDDDSIVSSKEIPYMGNRSDIPLQLGFTNETEYYKQISK